MNDDVYYLNDECFIFRTKPERLDNLPFIEPFGEKYLTIMKQDDIDVYFNGIDDDRPIVFNGIRLNGNTKYYYCDYCYKRIDDNWFYCLNCNRDMCKQCRDKDNDPCLELVERNIYSIDYDYDKCRYCDICDKEILFYDKRYIKSDFEICLHCYETSDELKERVKNDEMELIDASSIYKKEDFLFYHTGFNSLDYWIPLIRDNNFCQVLVNLNPDDINYKKVCLQCVDDHGRSGYYMVNCTLEEVIDKLKAVIEKGTYEEDGETKELDCKNSHYSSPICILMREMNIPVYYG